MSFPLFPLNTVLFPGCRLDLQIFEARYLDMIGRCMKQNGGFGVVAIVEGEEVGDAPERYSLVGCEALIRDWQQRWRQRDRKSEFPLFINRIVTNYLIRWHDIRKADYVGIFITDNRGAVVVSSIPQVEYYHGKMTWWQSVVKKGEGKIFVSDIFFDPSFGTHVVNVSAPIVDDEQHATIGAVTVLLRRDTLFHSISEVSVGKTGHAMLFNSEGAPVICPILAPEEHSITPELMNAMQVVAQDANNHAMFSKETRQRERLISEFHAELFSNHSRSLLADDTMLMLTTVGDSSVQTGEIRINGGRIKLDSLGCSIIKVLDEQLCMNFGQLRAQLPAVDPAMLTAAALGLARHELINISFPPAVTPAG